MRLAADCARAALTVLLLAVPAPASSAEPALAWQLLERDAPRLLWAGRNADLRVRVRNSGSATWSEAAGDHLSYHWLKPDGTMVEQDGIRAQFPAPVPPGAAVELTARVEAPGETGRWVLEWEMVREGVAWYGPPSGSLSSRLPVRVVFRSGILEVCFAVLGLAVALAARLFRPPEGSRAWLLLEAVPVALAWAGVQLVTVAFSELVKWQLWNGAGVLAASGAALLVLPVALAPPRARGWAAGALVVLASGAALADALYARYFGSIVPVVAMAAVRQVGRVEGSAAALLRPRDGWLLVGAATAVAFAVLWPRRRRGDTAERRARAGIAVALALLCLAAGGPAVRALRDAIRDPGTADQVFSQETLVGQWGLVNAHLFDALRTWREWTGGAAPDPAEEARARALMARRAAQSAAAAAKFGVARGDNLLLIQVESLQEWVIGATVRGVEITPYLNSLRRRALFFPWVFDETGQGRSSDGEFEALNSQHALDRGAVAFRRPRNHFVALPGILERHGYATLSAHPFDKGFWNRGLLHPRYGIQRMIFGKDLGTGEVIGWGLADGVFFERMVEPLKQERQPFFAFLITLGLHHPFDLFPAQHKVLDVGELRDTPLGNYIHAMHYFDGSFASFMTALEGTGLLANTVVALYGDHDAGLWVDGPLLSLAREPRWDPSVLVRLRRVPLLIVLPGAKLSGDVPVVGGQTDIAPTLLALLGIPAPPCFVGRALAPEAQSLAVLNDGSAIGDGHEYVTEGPMIPPGGACFAWPDGAARPMAECGALVQAGREELAASRLVVMHDLAAKIAGFTLP